MLSSPKHKNNLGAFSVPSSSSTSTSSSLGKNRSQFTMEEVWKEINLGSLHHHRQLNIGHEPLLKIQNPNSPIFQDFINMPLNHQQPPSSSSIVTAPATVLNLNSGIGFQFLDSTDALVASNPHSFEESARFGWFGKKRGQDYDESRGDRRHKRMIKNRESAARSRARKQECVSHLLFYSPILYNEKKQNLVFDLHFLCIKMVYGSFRHIQTSWSLKLLTCRQRMQDSRDNKSR